MRTNRRDRIFTVQWTEIAEIDKVTLTNTMAKVLKVSSGKADTLKRIFDLAKPDIIMGRQNGIPFCRLSETSRPVVELLMKNYF